MNRIIIAGGRDFIDYKYLSSVMDKILVSSGINEIVSGCAVGADTLGAAWAIENFISVKEFLPDWDKFGMKSGVLRNIEMGNYATGLIAFWDGKSRDTKHMIEYMKKLGKPVSIHLYNQVDKGLF